MAARRDPSVIDSVGALLRRRSAKQTLWFRGQPTFGLPLVPKLLREAPGFHLKPALEKNGDRSWEGDVNGKFRRRSASLIELGRSNADIYVLAQHYGLPTRLLDWTTGALTALFFAVAERDDDDGALFTLNPNYEFRVGARAFRRPISIRDPNVAQIIDCLFDLEQIPSITAPVPLLPNLERGRMLQQSTCFTLHLPAQASLPEGSYQEFKIPRLAKQRIRSELQFAGVTWSALFPELEYVVRDIQDELRIP